jgi:hypothetical protein
MRTVALEFTADGPELDHAEIDRMIAELEAHVGACAREASSFPLASGSKISGP